MNTRSILLVAALVAFAFYLGGQRGGDNPSPIHDTRIEIVAEEAARADAVLRGDAYRETASDLANDSISGAADVHAKLKERITSARDLAWQKLDDRIQAEIGGDRYSDEAAERLFLRIDSGLKRVGK